MKIINKHKGNIPVYGATKFENEEVSYGFAKNNAEIIIEKKNDKQIQAEVKCCKKV